MVRQLWKHPEMGITQLKGFANDSYQGSIDETLIRNINELNEDDALWFLRKIKEPQRIKTEGQREINVPIILKTLDTEEIIQTEGLLDSGCTTTSISQELVDRMKLNTIKLPRAITAINADGSINGKITDLVRLEMKIQDHEEILELAVTNLGKRDIFLGHNWLLHHNPTIDWTNGEIEFNRCPGTCRKRSDVREPEEEINQIENFEEYDQKEDKLLAIHIDTPEYIRAKSNFATDIAEAAQEKRTWKEIVPETYLPYKEVFEKQTFDRLPLRRPWDHAIKLIEGAKGVDCKIYPLNPTEQQQLDEFLKEQLETGRICPSKSPMASPFFFVKKKDGKLRPVQDYRKLNEMTIKNRYPLPLISELIDQLTRARYFSKMDVRWGYNNIRIKEGDEWKAAFRTNRGLFEPLVMFFGLTNSPATFQTMMNDIFREEIAEGWVVIYMDDILVFSKTLEEHRKQVSRILEKLRHHQLSLKAEKCYFEKEEIEFLGLIINRNGIQMDPHKVKAVKDWPVPESKRELQQFLGFVNFYRRFVQGFAKIAKPLMKLTGKNEWLWTELQQTAFEELKREVTSKRTLIIPKPGKPFRMETDASDFAIAAILSQEDEKGIWRPVAFISKSLNDAERNYEIYDKEMLAIMYGFYEWAHYLKGNDQITEVLTDHQNLTFFQKPQNLNRRQARWILDLQEYNFKISHRSGKSNTKADLLSRRADYPKGENDNRDVVLLKEELFRNIEIRLDETSYELLEIRDKVKKIH